MRSTRYTIFVLAVLSIYGCLTTTGEETARYLYNTKREQILKEFAGKSVIRLTDNTYQYDYYLGDRKNSFILEKKNNKWRITSQISGGYGMKNSESNVTSDTLVKKFVHLHEFMRRCKIRSVTSEFAFTGISLKIYLKNDYALLYVPTIGKVVNDEWINYLNAADKLDKSWYLIQDYRR